MTMMVLAIHLYDVGLRDDAVFWSYTAKDRFVTLADVIDLNGAGLAGLVEAVKSFVTLARPFINGYAYCDLANQRTIRAKALEWVESHPYGAILMEQLPAREDDRKAASLPRSRISATTSTRSGLTSTIRRTSPNFMAKRAANEMDAKYCWK